MEAPPSSLAFQGLLRFAGVFLFYVILFLLISLITQPELLHSRNHHPGAGQVEPGR
jgi:hypothetical protein